MEATPILFAAAAACSFLVFVAEWRCCHFQQPGSLPALLLGVPPVLSTGCGAWQLYWDLHVRSEGQPTDYLVDGEPEPMNADIVGVGIRSSLFATSVLLWLSLVAGHLHVARSAAKELGIAQLVNVVYLAFNLIKSYGNLSTVERLVAAISLEGASAAVSMCFSDKEVLSARWLIVLSLICQGFGIVSVALAVGTLPASSGSCRFQVFWGGRFDASGSVPRSFWFYFAFRCLSWLHNAWLGYFWMSSFHKAEHISTPLKYESTMATPFSKYLEHVWLPVTSFSATRTLVNQCNQSIGLLGEWGQSAALIVCLVGILHCFFIQVKQLRKRIHDHRLGSQPLESITKRVSRLRYLDKARRDPQTILSHMLLPDTELGLNLLNQSQSIEPNAMSGGSAAVQLFERLQQGLKLQDEAGTMEVIREYDAVNMSIGARDGDAQLAVQLTMEWGNPRVLRELLLRDVSVAKEARTGSGQTPLRWAAEGGHEAVVRLLLDRGAYIEAADKTAGWTPLHSAAKNGHEAVVQLLLDRGAHIEATDKISGSTPLRIATVCGHEAIVRLLLDQGAHTEAVDKTGRTPLWWAAANGREAVVRLLLDRGAHIEAANKTGWTPLWRAAARGHEAIAQLLLNRGANTEVADKRGWTPLHSATKNGHEAVVRLLLNQGADTEVADARGRTPLHWAAEEGHEAVVRLLLDQGAPIEAVDKTGRTPLWWAAANRREAVVRLLLDRGAHAEAADKTGWTPLSVATRRGHAAIVRLLQVHIPQPSSTTMP